MLREFFLFLSHSRSAQAFITGFPPARQMVARFVAGETVGDAIRAIRVLNAEGITATTDFLGESVTNRDEAIRAADQYLCTLDELTRSGCRSHISLKLTQLGLDLDYDFCLRNVRRVVEKAQALGNFVCVDMESTSHTDRTLRLVGELRREFDAIGTVLQAYLYRSEKDLIALTEAGVRIRLCKGAYKEPPDKAFPRKADVDANFIKLSKLLLDRSAPGPNDASGKIPAPAALATHDEKMIAAAKAYAAEKGIPRERFEFQMLYGVRRELQEQLVKEGFAVRAYVPYGTHWYPYFMRRLAERPANVWFFVSNYFRR
ncbi:MAG: proline dehydrogenase family protein [Anaerolineales bacterium]|nr:proline dehydrogenase family protein [Anaerolineales bacterium]